MKSAETREETLKNGKKRTPKEKESKNAISPKDF